MKGIVFTEFLEMVEQEFSYEMVDKLISASDLSTNGAYTAVGTYPFSEMQQLLIHLSNNTNINKDDLLIFFGKHLFKTFKRKYNVFFENMETSFQMLETIENHIHVEVKKLYPEAELPQFDCKRHDNNKFQMDYHSERALGSLAFGLIEACAIHFNENISIEQEDLSEGKGTFVRFLLTKQA